ncbi:hypothetical protein BDQ17DRAFT_443844 [Cyathus striatus]|nr:hypothetical protein BDQ17DRAFT_443844 [Cyathus striatus]
MCSVCFSKLICRYRCLSTVFTNISRGTWTFYYWYEYRILFSFLVIEKVFKLHYLPNHHATLFEILLTGQPI